MEDAGPRGPWKTTTAAYVYELQDSDSRALLSYHWHPGEGSTVTFPHLHLGPAAQLGHRPLATAHLPTNRIALEDMLRLAITEFDVEPLKNDWAEVLSRTEASYDEWRTW